MINKVGYTNPASTIAKANRIKRASKVSGSSFVDALDSVGGIDETQGVEATTPVAGLAGLGGLIGINEVSEEEVQRRKAFKHGKTTLDALADLRDALIIGTLPLATIKSLETLVAQERGTTNDPVLNSILDEIELRAAVEMAKLEMAGVRV